MPTPDKKRIIDSIIDELRYFAKLYSIDSLFVVGGYCRAKIFNDWESLEDIDVASAHPHEAMKFCGLFATEVLHTVPTFYRRSGSGCLSYRGIRIEFQSQSMNSYMKNETILAWMRKNGIRNTPLMNNVYGRDLTINSLIFSLKNGELYDLTKRAVEDIRDKKIDTLLPPELIVQFDPLIILRAIRFALRYDFIIAPKVREHMKKNKKPLIKSYSKERIVKEIEKIFQSNAKKGLEMLKRFDLVDLVVPEQLSQYILEEK